MPCRGEDIHAICFLEFIIRDVLEFFVTPLEGGVVHKDVDGAERVNGFQKSKEAADAAAKAATQAGLLGALALVLGAVVAAVGGMSAVPGIATINRTVARQT